MTTLHLPSGLSTLYPKLNLSTLEHELNAFGLTDVTVAQAFIAQCAHESAGFSRFVENLNYSAEGLAKTWRSRFANADGTPNATARKIARNPQAIANAVYNGRMGNVNPNDGWNFRGRGAIQITGRANYEAVGRIMAQYGVIESPEVILDNPDLLASDPHNLSSACAYWVMNGLSRYAGDMKTLTRKINGGFVGLDDRLAQLAKVRACFTNLEKY